MTEHPTLIVLLGSTGVGKSDLAISLACHWGIGIISADSRQIYREIPIGTAAPCSQDLAAVPHYFIGTRSVQEAYSAASYEQDALRLLSELFAQKPIALATGGSMMYIDALCYGIDDIPDVKPEIRESVYARWREEGLSGILDELRTLDPVYYEKVDHQNHKRVLHGYEICISSGRPFSSFHSGIKQQRPFDIIKIGIERPRTELYERINKRVNLMIEAGLEAEARSVYPLKHLNALNTVGYKELFAYFDGTITYEEAIRQIQKNSRVYARKQQTWWKRQSDIHWFPATPPSVIMDFLNGRLF